ncbi:MAG: urease accessory protein UreD [Nocardioides sp.]|uniref:urease accessory protein UreD n=1 Tax=Nocardioides sp. TaxID=35761 RepID=UPI0039E459AD
MHTPTTTRTETHLALARPEGGGRVAVRHRSAGGPDRPVIRPVLLTSDADGARVSLVPEGALLLAGDDVAIDVEVGAGATLVLVEPAGTVAYDMRGGSARYDVRIHVGAAGRLIWHGEPFVVTAGAVVRRRVRVSLGQSARLALRETLVLGRHGEAGGSLDQLLEVTTDGGQPVIADGLRTDRHPLVWGGHKAMSSVLLVGAELPEIATPPEPDGVATRFDLEAGGTLVRSLAGHAHRAELDRAWGDAVAAARA